jgi:hypothetical protein
MRLRITSVFYASSICPFLLVPIVLDRRSTLTLMMLHHPAFNRRIHKLAARGHRRMGKALDKKLWLLPRN